VGVNEVKLEDQVREALDKGYARRRRRKLREVYAEEGALSITAGRWLWFCVISALQMVATHPQVKDHASLQQAVDFARQLSLELGEDDAELGEILASGWQDVEAAGG